MTIPLGLIQHVFNTIGAARLWEGNPPLDCLARLLGALDDEGAERVGATVGEVLPLLRGDPDRLRLGLDLVRVADLYEAWPGIAALLRDQRGNADVLVAAAGLASHPGVPVLLSELLELATGTTENEPWQDALIQVRLNPNYSPSTDLERVASGEQWPGGQNWTPGDAPVVAIDPSAGDPLEAMSLALELAARGALVRRIPTLLTNAVVDPRWLALWSPVVTASAEESSPLLKVVGHGALVTTAGRLDNRARVRVVREAEQLLPPGSRFVTHALEQPQTTQPVAEAIMTPEFMAGGAHSRIEVAFLSGSRRHDLTEFGKMDELRPRTVLGQHYWSFGQLVAVRTWRYFKSISPGGVGRQVAARLVHIAQSEDATLVGVTRGGRVLAYDTDGDLVDVETGQTASEQVLTFADDLFKPFPLGGGRLAPHLLSPSPHTRVNPLVAGGTPVVDSSRVTAAAVHQMLADARQTQASHRSVEVVLSEYPELTPASILDADRLTRSVLATT